MPKQPLWWELPNIQSLGEKYGPEHVQLHVRNQGVTVTSHTVADRFRRLGWQLNFKARGVTDPTPEPPSFTSDKKVGTFNWREANHVLRDMQALKAESSYSQDTANYVFDTDEDICITSLCDLHMGSWGANYDTIERVTDELLSIKNLYAYLLGDEEHMAIKMRNVLEVSDNLMPPAMQGDYFESWLNEVQHKILGSTWENHGVMREESQAGRSMSALIKKRRVVYHSGIGHADIQVGKETYTFAVSHFFKGGRTEANPVNGQMKYLRMQAPDREIAMAGDSHVAAASKYIEGGRYRAVVNGGTAQTNSGYAKRHFSLKTFPVWPCIVLHPDTHMFTPYFSVAEWLATRRTRKAA